ncbi:distal tail protein Dit [Halobacillus sp. H74]|uniref:distal tail protein Dit n=1 Tax=Halobacillus sp. H74 TaxID=3457436 RepID=UPI003FCE1152
MYDFVDFSEVGTRRSFSSIQTIFKGTNLDGALTDQTGKFQTLTVSGRSDTTNRINTVEIPGKDGLLEVEGNTMKEREITVKYQISDQTNEGFRNRCNRLSAFLVGSGEVVEFTDEDAHFIGTVSSNLLPEEDSNTLVGTLTFLCTNPRKYGKQKEASFNDGYLTLNNEGTASTDPIFEIDVQEDLTHIDLVKQLQDDIEFIRIGRPPLASENVYERETLVMHDTCSTTNGWTEAGYVDSGYVEGNIVSEGGRFTPELFGGAISPYKWQGPSIKKSIGKSLDSYRLDVSLEMQNVGKGTGMIEVYLLDADNNTVAKIGIEDIWRTLDKIQAKFQLGPDDDDRFHHYREADYAWGWNDFKGVLRIWSHDHYEGGNRRIRPYFAIVEPDGTHNWVSSEFIYIGPQGLHDTPITQVQVAFRVWAPTSNKAGMFIDDIKVSEINPPPAEGIQYLALAGDKIIVDTAKEEMLLNGESIRMDRSFWSEYFELDPGGNVLYQYPAGALNTKVKYSPAYR